MVINVRIPAAYRTQEGILTVDEIGLNFVIVNHNEPAVKVPTKTIIGRSQYPQHIFCLCPLRQHIIYPIIEVQAKSDKKGPAIRITAGEFDDASSQKNYIFTFQGPGCLENREKLIKALSEIIKRNKIIRGSEQARNNKATEITEADIENRLYLLLQNKELSALHSELVQSGLIPESEFWESRQVGYINYQFP